MKQAVSYIRVSSTKQLDGDGPERQRAGTNAFPGFSVVREFIDDISGTKLERPAFDEMLAYCREYDIETILIDKTDRFTRDLFVGLQLIAICAKHGLNIIDCTTGKSITRPENSTEQLVVDLLMVIARFSKNQLVETMAAARKRIRKSGRKCEGQKALREIQAFQPAIQRMKELRDQGVGYEQIASTVQAEGFTTKYGGPWCASTVWQNLNG